ncbi:MAG TPA: hypothetical protein VGZ22_26860 [Isosphaeraceae bacterium]|jgi:hypothetical protein|nr:hypothetical protein [Isosphaeraceae bacterium]
MTDATVRNAPRLEPALAWTVLTDAPLLGFSLAREAGLIFAWDEAGQLYLLDTNGERRSASRAPDQILAGAISDNGMLIALLGKGPRLWLLNADLEPTADRPAPTDPLGMAVDPHGRYVAVTSRLNFTQFYSQHGRQAGKFETRQALAHVCFIPSRPYLIGTAPYGAIVGVKLRPGSSGHLDAEVLWHNALLSNVGRLTTTGDGGMVLASCFTHGVQRYDLRGHNEGSYHLGGTTSQAVPDFAGRSIAVATLEGDLAVLNSGGNVRWKTALPRAANALELDALGRFLVYGLPTGEISRLDLESPGPGSSRRRQEGDPPVTVQSASAHRSAPVRTAAWTVPVAQSDEQAETSVLTVLDDPPRIGFLTGRNRLQIFTAEGEHLGQGPELGGVGRILKTAPGWIGAATDRNIVLYDARNNMVQRLDISLVQLTHLIPRPEGYGVAIVQERDRIGRASPAGRWIWKKELKSAVEDIAVGPDNTTAVTTDVGELLIFDAAGQPAGSYSSESSEAICMVEALAGASDSLAWITLARRFQTLVGHDVAGKVLWQTPIPWEGWQLLHIGSLGVVTAADGRALAFDGSGRLRGQSRAGDHHNVFVISPAGDEVWVVARQGVHLICTDLEGRVNWRAVADEPLGPLAASRLGVAVVIGRSLAWFPADGTT